MVLFYYIYLHYDANEWILHGKYNVSDINHYSRHNTERASVGRVFYFLSNYIFYDFI